MKIRTSLIVSTAALFLTAVSWGGTITITNPSFESPSCGTQSPTVAQACGDPTGWTQGGNDLAAAFLPAADDTQAESGLQYAYVNGGADLFQILAGTLSASTEYTFSVDVLNRTNPGTTGFCTGCVFDPVAEIVDADTNAVLGTATGSTPAVGSWTDWSASFAATPSEVGDEVYILLLTNGSSQGDFDNVMLSTNTTSSVPEPSTFMFAGAGLLGLGFAARRRLTR